jgi:hypothetical protein
MFKLKSLNTNQNVEDILASIENMDSRMSPVELMKEVAKYLLHSGRTVNEYRAAKKVYERLGMMNQSIKCQQLIEEVQQQES